MVATLLLTLAGLGLGWWLSAPLLGATLGFVLGRILHLELVVRDLRARLTALEPRAAPVPRPDAVGLPPAAPVLSLDLEPDTPAPPPRPVGSAPASPRAPPPAPPERSWTESLRDWLLAGNLFVRVGILLVFLGVGFFIRYAVERQWLVFTLEWGLGLVALGGLAVLGLGWSLRQRQRDYGLLLQGAGVGVLYLDLFGAFALAGLLPASLTVLLLLAVGATAAGLAVAQRAPALAWFGFAGGFGAPLVVGWDCGTPWVLFGFYSVLNLALLLVTWWRGWRGLHLLGLVMTFGVALWWVWICAQPLALPTQALQVLPWLALLLAFYIAIAVLDTRAQPRPWRGYVDASLVFGAPALAFSAAAPLLRAWPDGLAWASGLLGVGYLALAAALRRGPVTGRGLLSQSFAVIGTLFVALAVPFALAPASTAMVWALQGAALVWIGVRQARPWLRLFGFGLQVGAALAWVAAYPWPAEVPFRHAGFLAALAIAVAGAISAYWLDAARLTAADPGGTSGAESGPESEGEPGVAPWLLLWSLCWWFGAAWAEFEPAFGRTGQSAAVLMHGLLTLLLLDQAARRGHWRLPDRVLAAAPALGLLAAWQALGNLDHPAQAGGAWAWPLFLLGAYAALWRSEGRGVAALALAVSHVVLTLLLLALLHWEAVWRLLEQAAWVEGWRVAALALVPCLGLFVLTFWPGWPRTRWPFAYGGIVGGALVLTLLAWAIWSSESSGAMPPWPWLPLVNPVDGLLGLIILAMLAWARWLARDQVLARQWGTAVARDALALAAVTIGLLCFLWINLVLLRTLHQVWGIPYRVEALVDSALVQMALAVLWGLLGTALLLLARWRVSRPLWFAGALLLGLVVVKLFAIDLAASGTLERVISFLAVGGLMAGLGWLVPLPPHPARDSAAAGVRVSRG